jgi:hypothetical protein
VTRRLTVVPVIFWLGVGALVLGCAAWLASCATKPLPPCVPYEYRLVEDEDGEKYRVLDAEDVAKLHALIEGLAHGICRLPTAQAPRPTPAKGLQI